MYTSVHTDVYAGVIHRVEGCRALPGFTFPHGAGCTRIMKLLFLIDAEAKRRYGYAVTCVSWRRWLFGPFSRDVLEKVRDLMRRFVGLLEELSKYVNGNGKESSIPPVLRRRMKEMYEELIDIVARAVEG